MLSSLLFIIFLTSVISFFVGLVSPKTLSRIFHKDLNRKRSCLIFACIALFTFVSIGVVESKKSQPSLSQTSPTSTANILSSTSSPETSVPSAPVIAAVSTSGSSSLSHVASPTKPTVVKPVVAASKPVPAPSAATSSADYVLVVKAVDGDTIELEGGKRLRYVGMDTPESVDPRRPVQCFAKEASARNKALVVGKKVRLVKDVSDTDHYGRLLRYVYLEDGTFVNDLLVREGYARVYTYPPDVAFSQQFKLAEQEARAHERGLWSPDTCNGGIALAPAASSSPMNSSSSSASAPTVQTAPQSSSTVPVAQPTSGHTWYTSSYYTADFYYCDTDEQWKLLSPRYLKSFSSPEQLLAKYKRTLHEACQ